MIESILQLNLSLPSLTLSLIGGLALGLFYFAGLWFTLKQISGVKRPFLLLWISFLLRLTVSLFVFYWVVSSTLGLLSIIKLLLCMGGFLLVRTIMIRSLVIKKVP